MPPNSEAGQQNPQSETDQVRLEARAQIQEAKQTGQEENLKNALLQELQNSITAAEQVRQTVDEVSRAASVGQNKQQLLQTPEFSNAAKNATRAVTRMLEAVKAEVISPPPAAKAVFDELSKKNISGLAAPYLQPFLEKYVNQEISFSPTGQVNQFESEVKRLQQENKPAADLLLESMYSAAREGKLNVTEEELQKKFETERRIRPNEDEASFEGAWQQYYSSHFEASDREILQAIHDPDKFVALIRNRQNEVMEKLRQEGVPEADLQKRVQRLASEEIESEILTALSKPLLKLDRYNASEFYDEIVKRDFFKGIETTITQIERALNLLQSKISADKDKYADLGMWKKKERVTWEMKEVDVDTGKKDEQGKPIKEKHSLPVRRIDPLIGTDKIALGDYVQYITSNYRTYIEVRKYLHNVNAIFLRPPGEKGFYHSLQEYSTEINTLIMDEMNLLPDRRIFQAALQLYDKYIEEDLVSANWILRTDMFRSEIGSNKGFVQQRVLDRLKEMFPEMAKKDEGRLLAALNMAIGASRGIYMTEIEKAAYADPSLDTKAEPTYLSSHFRDPYGLFALNPLHLIWRFQVEGLMNPIYFLPVDGLNLKGGWDHKKLFEKIKQYRSTYLQGRSALGKNEEKLFMDFMMNIGRIGGPIKRAGWRTFYGYEGMIENMNAGSTDINYLETWKRLEKVGYEVLLNFVKEHISGKVSSASLMEEGHFKRLQELMGKGGLNTLYANPDILEKVNNYLNENGLSINQFQKRELFEYVYRTYFDEEVVKSGQEPKPKPLLPEYYKGLLSQARKTVEHKILKGELSPKDNAGIEEEIQSEASNLFLYRTLSRVIGQRIPTKFIRIERDRMTQNGVRAWENIRQEYKRRIEESLRESKEKEEDKNKRRAYSTDVDKFSGIIDDILFAETCLRQEVSDRMHAIREDESLSHVDYEYRLSTKEGKNNLRSLLEKNGISDERIKRAEEVFTLISKQYSSNEDYLNKFADLIKDKEKPYYPFTFAMEELDTSFLAFRSDGPNMLTRAISEISGVEQNVVKEIFGFANLLHGTAIDGKKDFGKVIESIQKMKGNIEGMHGKDYAHEVAIKMASLAISYFKKDTTAKLFFGLLRSGVGNRNSLAAEFAGRSAAVWEWDSREIDKFCVALETANIIPNTFYDKTKPMEFEPVWGKNPLTGKPMKTPFNRRKKNFTTNSYELRDKFGGAAKDIMWDVINKYGPIALIVLMYYFLSKSYKEWFEKKK